MEHVLSEGRGAKDNREDIGQFVRRLKAKLRGREEEIVQLKSTLARQDALIRSLEKQLRQASGFVSTAVQGMDKAEVDKVVSLSARCEALERKNSALKKIARDRKFEIARLSQQGKLSEAIDFAEKKHVLVEENVRLKKELANQITIVRRMMRYLQEQGLEPPVDSWNLSAQRRSTLALPSPRTIEKLPLAKDAPPQKTSRLTQKNDKAEQFAQNQVENTILRSSVPEETFKSIEAMPVTRTRKRVRKKSKIRIEAERMRRLAQLAAECEVLENGPRKARDLAKAEIYGREYKAAVLLQSHIRNWLAYRASHAKMKVDTVQKAAVLVEELHCDEFDADFTLRVQVLGAVSLKAASVGSSSYKVKLFFAEQTFETKVSASDHGDPVWENECHDFVVETGFAKQLVIHAVSKGIFSNQVIGACQVKLDRLPRTGETLQQFVEMEFADAKLSSAVPSGKVELKLQLLPRNVPNEVAEYDASTKGKSYAKPMRKEGLLRVQVLRAFDLYTTERWDEPDPYCEVSFAGEVYQTYSCTDTGRSPVWKNCVHEFVVSEDTLGQIDLKVCDKNVVKDRVMGIGTLFLNLDLDDSPQTMVVDVHSEGGVVAGFEGKVELQLALLPQRSSECISFRGPDRISQCGKTGKLFVTLKRAMGLRQAQLVGTQDPYCELRIGETSKVSLVIEDGGINPVWENATMTFDIADDSPSCLFICVKDKNFLQDTVIGEGFVELTEVMACSSTSPKNHSVDLCWVHKSGKSFAAGTVELELTLDEEVSDPVAEAMKKPLGFTGLVRISLTRCIDLSPSGWELDKYCKVHASISLGNETYKTVQTTDGGCNATWKNCTHDFRVNETTLSKLVVVVKAEVEDAIDVVGLAQINLSKELRLAEEHTSYVPRFYELQYADEKLVERRHCGSLEMTVERVVPSLSILTQKDERRIGNAGSLIVRVWRCFDLKCKEQRRKLVRLRFNDLEYTSEPSEPAGENPTWPNCGHEFDMEPGNSSILEIELYQNRLVKRNLLATATLDILQFLECTESRRALPLQSVGDDSIPLGMIDVELKADFHEGLEHSSKADLMDERVLGVKGKLYIRCVRGFDLDSTEFIGTPDPYVRLTLAEATYKSGTATDGGATPVWSDCSTMFNILTGTSNLLQVAVYNKNLLKDKLIGDCQLDLSDIVKCTDEVQSKTLTLKRSVSSKNVNTEREKTGRLELDFRFISEEEADESFSCGETVDDVSHSLSGRLRIQILRAIGLRSTSRLGQNPYPTVAFGEATYVGVVGHGNSPTWDNCAHEFEVVPGGPGTIKMSLRNRILGPDALIGSTTLSLLEVSRSAGAKIHKTYALNVADPKGAIKDLICGEVEVVCSFHEAVDSAEELNLKKPLCNSGLLQVRILRAFELNKVERKQDPYVIIKFAGTVWRSHTANNAGTDPTWENEVKMFKFDQETPARVVVQVFDEELGQDKLIGQGQFSVLDLIQMKRCEKKLCWLQYSDTEMKKRDGKGGVELELKAMSINEADKLSIAQVFEQDLVATIQLRNVDVDPSSSASDVFVTLSLGEDIYRSKPVARQNGQYRWSNSTHDFDLSKGEKGLMTVKLWQHSLLKDTIVGVGQWSMTESFTGLFLGAREILVPLCFSDEKLIKRKDCGTVALGLSVRSKSIVWEENDETMICPRAGMLRLKALRAYDLRSVERLGVQDPFVVMQVNEKECRTGICRDGGREPVWDTETAWHDFSLDELSSVIASIKVLNHNQVQSHSCIGAGRLTFPSSLFTQHGPCKVVCNLDYSDLSLKTQKKCGAVELEASFCPLVPLPISGRLEVAVLHGANLKRMQRATKGSTKLRLSIGETVYETTASSVSDHAATWSDKTKHIFQLKKLTTPSLDLQLTSCGMFGSSSAGAGRVLVSELIAKSSSNAGTVSIPLRYLDNSFAELGECGIVDVQVSSFESAELKDKNSFYQEGKAEGVLMVQLIEADNLPIDKATDLSVDMNYGKDMHASQLLKAVKSSVTWKGEKAEFDVKTSMTDASLYLRLYGIGEGSIEKKIIAAGFVDTMPLLSGTTDTMEEWFPLSYEDADMIKESGNSRVKLRLEYVSMSI